MTSAILQGKLYTGNPHVQLLTKSLAHIEVDPERFGMECARGIVEYFKTDKSPELDFPEPVYIRGETFPVPD